MPEAEVHGRCGRDRVERLQARPDQVIAKEAHLRDQKELETLPLLWKMKSACPYGGSAFQRSYEQGMAPNACVRMSGWERTENPECHVPSRGDTPHFAGGGDRLVLGLYITVLPRLVACGEAELALMRESFEEPLTENTSCLPYLPIPFLSLMPPDHRHRAHHLFLAVPVADGMRSARMTIAAHNAQLRYQCVSQLRVLHDPAQGT